MKNKFLYVLIFCFLSSGTTFAEPDFNPAILNPAGIINTHDMEILKRFELEKQGEKDLQKYKENNEQKEKNINEKVEKDSVDKSAIKASFNKGVYKADSPDNKNPYKNYFYVFYNENSGYTEDSKMGIGLPFSCIKKDDYIKFKFGGTSEPEEIFKIKSVENGVITGYFENGSLLIFTPILDANPDNFDVLEYKKQNILKLNKRNRF